MTKTDLIRGDNGRTYRRQADGRLSEVFDPAAHAKRQAAAITSGHTIAGVRLVDAADPDGEAVVVTMTPDEAAPVVAAVKAVLANRSKA